MKKRRMKHSKGSAEKGRSAYSGEKNVAHKSYLKKQYLKSDNSCKVTFRLPKQAVRDAETVAVLGDFNNWKESETMMKKLKSGDFTVTLKLEPQKEYRFRYLIDSKRWENDWDADKYLPNEFGSDDSVIIL